MLPSAHPNTPAVPLAQGLQNLSHSEIRDPAELCKTLNGYTPVRDCRSLVPDPQCLHRVGHLKIGSSVLISDAGTPTIIEFEDTPLLNLLIGFQGTLDVDTTGGHLTLGAQGAALLPPGQHLARGSHFSVAIITLEPQAVAAASFAIAGPSHRLAKPVSTLVGFPPLSLGPGPQAQMIHGLVHTIDATLAVGPSLATQLALDDVLHRTAAALLNPGLLSNEPPDLESQHDLAGRRSFDRLIDHIRANLDQPLRLSDLEAKSHYSRRALQYAFRERFNATPKQWIREQRLSLALEHLQHDGYPRPSVQEVALRCGYLQVSQFSKDFKQRFGITPSEARRL